MCTLHEVHCLKVGKIAIEIVALNLNCLVFQNNNEFNRISFKILEFLISLRSNTFIFY